MNNLKIYYIVETQERPITDIFDIVGGIKIIADDIILTKMVDCENDEGYCGNFLFIDIKCLISHIQKMILGEKVKCEIDEDFYTFIFEPIGDLIYFSIKHRSEMPLAEEFDRKYPGEGNGYPLPAKLFMKEIVALGHRFIDDITYDHKGIDKNDINAFKEILENADNYVNEYTQNN